MDTPNRIPAWRGPVLMCVASLFFAFLDTGTKYLAAGYPLMQIVWLRYVAQTLAIAIIFTPRMGTRLFDAHSFALQGFRGLCLCGGSVMVINGLARLPLAEATAVVFLAPVIVTMLSGLLLKEKARAMDWVAVACGFAGVLIIARPGGGLLTWAILFPIGAATTNAIYQIVTRLSRQSENAATSNFYTGLVGAIVLMPWGIAEWAPIPAGDLILVCAIGTVAAIGHLTITYALLAAPAASLGAYSYSQIGWATLLGWGVFLAIPDAMSWLGMLVIALGGILLSVPQLMRALTQRLGIRES
ncbi:MAG TPA: DMT family transporter [Castellaniella sp.]|uniref:DMT family transporter n=1 Tax=Castellaniella sp. TaxID=1955812 RepID=UPI002EE9A4A9